MRKASIIAAGLVTIVLCLTFLHPFIIYLFGCFQIGSWVGDFINRQINNDI
jgi:hypothetical protein